MNTCKSGIIIRTFSIIEKNMSRLKSYRNHYNSCTMCDRTTNSLHQHFSQPFSSCCKAQLVLLPHQDWLKKQDLFLYHKNSSEMHIEGAAQIHRYICICTYYSGTPKSGHHLGSKFWPLYHRDVGQTHLGLSKGALEVALSIRGWPL